MFTLLLQAFYATVFRFPRHNFHLLGVQEEPGITLPRLAYFVNKMQIN